MIPIIRYVTVSGSALSASGLPRQAAGVADTFLDATLEQLSQLREMVDSLHPSQLDLLLKWVNGRYTPSYEGNMFATALDFYIWWLHENMNMYGGCRCHGSYDSQWQVNPASQWKVDLAGAGHSPETS